MEIDYDRDTDIMMIELSEGEIDHAEQVDNVIVHLSREGKPALLEILDFSDLLSRLTEVTVDSQKKETVET